jgi:ribosomal protein S18 acetylase RimI-like enzyme
VRARPLHDVSLKELRALLEEEKEHWKSELLWDYSEVSSAVASGVERRALTGRVMHDGSRSVAYCYYMMDSGRAIVGSLFATEDCRGRGLEEDLVDAVLAEAQAQPGNDRVECQTLFSTAPGANGRFARAGFEGRGRHYMVRDLRRPLLPPPAHPYRLRTVRRDDLPAAAELVYRSHRGTVDAALNLTYATPGLCRGFVDTLVLRSGCGRFDPEASVLAEGPRGPLGVLLASHLSRTNGHVCQVSVVPEAQGRGLGTVLMAAALRAFCAQGVQTASLSVTVDNVRAHRLYDALGFELRKEFAAHAWVRPPARIDVPA